MEEADSENKGTPVSMVNFINEFLSNNSSKSFIETCLKTLRRFISDLECFLKKPKGEFRMLFASNPKTEVFMN